MRRRLAMAPLLAAVLGMAATVPIDAAVGQTIPEGQSCGGLVCDLGIFGHKTTPGGAATPPTSAPARTASVPPVTPEPKVAPEPKVRRARAPKRIAKATPAPVPAPASAAAPAAEAILSPPPSAPARTAPELTAPVATPKPAVSASAAVPSPGKDEVFIRTNPYTTGLPTPTLILPIGPAPPPQ